MMTDKDDDERVRTVSAGSPVHLQEPHGTHRSKQRVGTVVVHEVQDFIPVKGFVNFLREHAVVGLAIGFIIGIQAQGLVNALVNSFINPAFNLFFGQSLSSRSFTLHFHTHEGHFVWGGFVYGVLNFIFVLGAIYLIFKLLKLDKLDKPKAKE